MRKRKIKLFQQLRYLCLAGVCILGLITIIASGGGDGEDGPPVDTTLPLSLTAGNAEGVTGLVLDAAEGAITAGSIPQGIVSTANPLGRNTFKIPIIDISMNALERILEVPLDAPAGVWGRTAWPPTDPATVSCTGGNTVTIDYDDADTDNIVSAGDSATLDYNNCGELGLTLNGDLFMSVMTVTNDPSAAPPWFIRLRLDFDLTATDGGDVIRVVGLVQVDVNATAMGTVDITVTTELAPVGGGPPISQSLQFEDGSDFIELTGLTIGLTVTSTDDFSISAQGTLESTLIGGTITFLTTQLLTGNDFDNNDPDAGEMEIGGGGNSAILLEVVDDTNVRLHIDADGDGIYAVPPINTTWNALDAAADIL